MTAPTAGSATVRVWIRKHPFRFFVYVFLLAIILVGPLLLCLRGGALMGWLANRKAARAWAERLGIAFQVEAIRLRCLGGGGCSGIEATGIEARLLEAGSTPIRVARARACWSRPLSIESIMVGENPALLDIEGLQVDLRTGRVEARGARALPTAGAPPLLSVETLSIGAPAFFETPETRLEIPKVTADGTQLVLQRESGGGWNFERAPSFASASGAAGRIVRRLLDGAAALVARGRRLLLWTLVVLTALLSVAKLLLTPQARWPLARLGLAGAAVVLPYAVYFFPGKHVSLGLLLALALIAALTMAGLLQRAVYRSGREFHERWEPFVLDVISPLLIVPLLAAYAYRLPFPLRAPSSVSVAALEGTNISAVVRDEKALEIDLARLSEGKAAADQIHVRLDPESVRLRSVELANVAFEGLLESVRLSQELGRLEFLPPEWRSIRVPVDLRLTETSVRSSATSPEDAPEWEFATRAELSAPPLNLELEVDGEPSRVHLRKIRSLEGSRLEIAEGTGSLTRDHGARLSLELRDVAVRRPELDVAAGSLEIALPIAADSLSVTAGLNEITARRGDAFAASMDHVAIDLRRMQDSGFALATELRSLAVTGRRPGELNPWLVAELPSVRADMRGRTAPGWVPPKLAGSMSLLISRRMAGPPRAGDVAFQMDSPLRFSSDVWRGAVEVPLQVLRVEQSIVSQAPDSLSLRLSLNARLESLPAPFGVRGVAHIHIPRLAPDVRPLEAELNDIDVRASMDWGANGPGLRAKYQSDWSRILLPDPRAYDVLELTSLDLETRGVLERLRFNELGDLHPLDHLIGNLGGIPRGIPLRVEGQWPAGDGSPFLQVRGKSGSGLQIGEVSGHMERLIVRGARLENLDAATGLSPIETLDGQGALELESRLAISGTTAAISTVAFREGTPLLTSTLRRSRGETELRVPDLSLEKVFPATKPFLEHWGFDRQGVNLEARVTDLTASGRYAPSSEPGWKLHFDLPAGRLASLDFSKLFPGDGSRTSRSREVWLDPDNAEKKASVDIQIESEGEGVSANALVRGTHLRVTDESGRTDRLGVDFTSRLRLAPRPPEGPPIESIPAKLRTTFANLRDHLRKALEVFSTAPGSGPRIENVAWDMRFGNPSPGEPVFSLETARWSLRSLVHVRKLAWTNGDGKDNSLAGSLDVASDLSLHRGALVAEGYLIAGDADPKLRLPYLAAFLDRLPTARQRAELLWDPEYFESFWKSYPVSLANAGPVSLVDEKEMTLGPLSLQHVLVPAEALRVAIGHEDEIQLHIPARARLFYGQASGLAQARLRFLEDHASMDGRLKLALQNLSASAFGLAAPGGHVPLIEDRMDGELEVRADQFPLNQEIGEKLRVDPSGVEALSRVGLALDLRRSAGVTAPGVLQLSVDTEIDLLNDLLNRTVRKVQLSYPPRTMLYDDFRLSLRTDESATEPLLVEILGLRMLPAEQLDLRTDLRLHWGRNQAGFPRETLSLQDLLKLAELLTSNGGRLAPPP